MEQTVELGEQPGGAGADHGAVKRLEICAAGGAGVHRWSDAHADETVRIHGKAAAAAEHVRVKVDQARQHIAAGGVYDVGGCRIRDTRPQESPSGCRCSRGPSVPAAGSTHVARF